MIESAEKSINWHLRASVLSKDYVASPWINGKAIRSSAGETYSRISSHNEQKIADLSVGSRADAELAIHSGKTAFQDGRWANLSPQTRRDILLRLASIVEQNAQDLALLDCIDVGKPISAALGDVAVAVEFIRYAASAVDKMLDEVVPTNRQSIVLNIREPVGVVAAIIPWNYPFFIAAQKIAPALAGGNSVVLKPSEMSPLSALALARLASEAGLPDGVFNVVPGLGPTVGTGLVEHPDVSLITFTGSTQTGKSIMRAAAGNLKKVILECGGKSPHVIFADIANIDAVADDVVEQITTNQGQLCVAGSRLLVEQSIHQDLVEAVLTRMRAIECGDPLETNTTYGPLVSETHLRRVQGYIDEAKRSVGTLLTGGSRVKRSGFYMEPTVFDSPNHDSRLCQEEVFGPVLAILPFGSEDEALRIAKNVDYGLAARIWTQDLSRAYRLSRAIGAGEITINAACPCGPGVGPASAAEPFGQSGLGVEGGLDGIRQFTRRKAITINMR